MKVQETKQNIRSKDPRKIEDIVDGVGYRELCEEGQFLESVENISVIFNSDGIPLYASSKVKLWPIFMAINEEPLSQRFARDNMILAGIWQGKSSPPFQLYFEIQPANGQFV